VRSTSEHDFALPVSAAAPLGVLPPRVLRVAFPLPSPLLRALGPGETSDGALWSDWLAGWGWAWAVVPAACAPKSPLVDIWLDRGRWPRGFDSRVLALAVALKLRVDGDPLVADGAITSDLARVWSAIQRLSQENLGEMLALALLRADSLVFDFASVAPSWPGDVSRVVAERRSLGDDREPTPLWLREGYRMLGDDGFAMLRAEGKSLQDCTEVWDSFTGGRELPDAFALCFWWEATYCLTERHAYDDAARAQATVESLIGNLKALSGIVDPMWHHQQGRLHYYAGNHESALAEYLREYQAHGDDLNVAAMLAREIANVFSDLSCLEAAHAFAARSIDVARSQGQKTELYKSLGRLAEIAIKRGDPLEAVRLYEESLAIQKKLSWDNRAPAQTLTYLGHASLLASQFQSAADWYAQAEAADGDGSSRPYITMGRMALALAEGNVVGLTQLWSANDDRVADWGKHQTHVLPAAVCTLAASRHSEKVRDRLPGIIRSLVDNRYAVEAAFLLKELPEECRLPMVREVESILVRWQKSLGSMPPTLKAIAGPLNGPQIVAEGLRRGNLRNDPDLAAAGYPLTLVG